MMYLCLLALCGVAFGTQSNRNGAACSPLAIPNAMYNPQVAAVNSIAAKGRVQISCAPGYENTGSDWVVCGDDGQWKTAPWAKNAGVAPACHASCSPPEIENAEFNPSIAGNGMTRHGSKVEVTCAEGYEFVGDKYIECYHGTFTGIEGARCFMANESFCRDDNLVPLVAGAMRTYAEDPLKATEYLNKAILMFKGIQSNGLSFIGLEPSLQYKPFETNAFYVPGITGSDATFHGLKPSLQYKNFETNAFYVPGITGSDATFQSLVVPGTWNVTSVPVQFELQNLYCRVFDEENELTAYVLKVLYKSSWGQFALGQKK